MRNRISTGFSLAVLIIALSGRLEAQTGTIMPSPFQVVLDNSGKIVNNACVWTYIAGTTTAAATYTDQTLSTPNSNPIRADSAGRFSAFLSPGSAYKFSYESSCTPPSHGTLYRTADQISAMPGSSANLDIVGTAGEALTAGQAVYLSDGSGGKTGGQWYKADSTNPYSSTTSQVGLVPASIGSGSAGTVRLSGSMIGLASLTVGAQYFVSTAGAITTTAPTNARLLGSADTTASLVVAPQDALTAAPPNGTLLIGNGGTFKQATLTAGGGIQITNAAGAITLANGVLDRQTPLITNGNLALNTTAETVIYTFAVPGGTLGTNKTLHLSLLGDLLNNSGGGLTYTVRVKYGATTIFAAAMSSIPSGANRGLIDVDLELTAAAATNAQRAKARANLGDTNASNVNGAAASVASGTNNTTLMYGGHTSVAIDSTASQNLVVTFQMSGANAASDMRAHTVYTEVR